MAYIIKKISTKKMYEHNPRNPDGYLIAEEYEVYKGAKKLFTIEINGVNILARKNKVFVVNKVHKTYDSAESTGKTEKQRLEAEGNKEITYEITKLTEENFQTTLLYVEMNGNNIKKELAQRIKEELNALDKKEKEESTPFVSPVENEFTVEIEEENHVI